MTREQTSVFRDRLRALATRLGNTVAGLEEGVRTPTGGQTAGGLSNAPLHLGDVGTDAFHQELDATLLENEAFIRNEVSAALDRVKKGTFGRCENCGRDIILERLDALPYVRYCTRCASRLQSGLPVNLNNGRPPSWLGEPGHESTNATGSPERVIGRELERGGDDRHAASTPGGGTAKGGLAGTNLGSGSPRGAKLERAMGSSAFDEDMTSDEEEEQAREAYSGRSGGAVGGTPANKRARGGKTSNEPRGKGRPAKSKKRPPR